jgi:hypothetical protein
MGLLQDKADGDAQQIRNGGGERLTLYAHDSYTIAFITVFARDHHGPMLWQANAVRTLTLCFLDIHLNLLYIT